MSTTQGWTPSELELSRRRTRRQLHWRHVATATGVTIVVLVLLAWAVTLQAGWPTVKDKFFSLHEARKSLPDIWQGFWVNVKMFLLCEPVILVLALGIALARSARSPWLAPVRLLAVVWTDLFRGIPTLLLVFLFALGIPALQLSGLTNSAAFWAATALVVSYSAYVAEVFRSGIDAVHPSQWSSATALGLSRGQALRFVIVPQAVRRVVPPLLNDFVSLQKDTALAGTVGVFEGFGTASDAANYSFNYTPMVVVGVFFIVIVVPVARFTDWLQRRYLERERAGAL